MYKLKAEPEDFVVEEVSKFTSTSGNFAVFRIKKRDYSHFKVLSLLAKVWKCRVKDIGFAGTKDKRAITTQLMSVKGVSKETIEKTSLEDIEIEYVGQSSKPIALGDLCGNRFEITIKEFEKKPVFKNPFVNYYGEQRFSTNNAEIGKLLVLKKYEEAVTLIKESRELEVKGNDYVGALQQLPKTLLSLYVGAYQAELWNLVVEEYVSKNTPSDIKVPLLGFGTDDEMYENIMKEEGITSRDFINRSIQGLNAHGDTRKVWAHVEELEVEEKEDIVMVKFVLPKGSYATEFIRQGFA